MEVAPKDFWNSVASGITSGIVSGLIVGFILHNFTRSVISNQNKRVVNEADNFNLFVACQVKSVFNKEGKNFLVSYDTKAYRDNFDAINVQPSSTQRAIRENLILMESSNKMMNLLFELPQKRAEFAPKLISNAAKIIENFDVYNEQVIEGECKDH